MTQQDRTDLQAAARERIKWVTSILGPGCDKAEVESTVLAIVVEQDLYRYKRGADFRRRSTNKKEKKAIESVAKAARRLNVALKHPALPSFVKKLFPTDQEKTISDLEKLGLASLHTPKRPGIYLRRRATALCAPPEAFSLKPSLSALEDLQYV
jgi:hypothetical protein